MSKEQFIDTPAGARQSVTNHIVDDIRRNRENSRVEITEQVIRQNESHGSAGIYLEGKKIGHLPGGDQQFLYEMAEGFEFDKNKVYKKKVNAEQNKEHPQSYVDGCDMGWC